ncbi:MAG: beta-ketoacyl synthase, partial [Desulfobacterales bacterium]|nr:beta-ketoacyl synthase [Desulfobacterales bacterium]
IWVANKNSEKQTAVSGGKAEIEQFVAWLKREKTLFKKLPLSGAFHTPLFQSAAARMATHLAGVPFRRADYTRIISNVTGEPYPRDEAAVKELLARQIVSPVEFIASVTNARAAGAARVVEIGPGALLINLLKNIPLDSYMAIAAIDVKLGEIRSLERLDAYMEKEKRVAALVAPPPAAPAAPPVFEEETPITSLKVEAPRLTEEGNGEAAAFDEFLKENDGSLKKLMYREFLRHKKEKAIRAAERFDFHGGKIAIAGVAAGLPGTGNKVFNANNFDKLLAGFSFIEPLDQREKERIVDMNITRVFKNPDGSARFMDINRTEDVIQLAGKLGYFDLRKEYGLDFDYDITISLAIAAGLEALKDARIPMVMNYRKTSTGGLIPDGFALPEEMRDNTGVIMTSLFPGFETLIEALNRYYYNKFYVKPYDELENIYYHLMEVVKDNTIKGQLTEWFFRIKERRKVYGTFTFDRNILFDLIPLGSAHFAQLLKARGPNIQMSGACASTTQAVGVAEDWIR